MLIDINENDLSQEWIEEIQPRWANFEEGVTVPLDGEEVAQKLAEKHGLYLA